MKMHKFFVLGIGLLYLTSCSKDENVQQSTFSNVEHQSAVVEMIQFENKEEYQDKIANQIAFFEAMDVEASRQSFEYSRTIPELTEDQLKSDDFDQSAVKSVSDDYVHFLVQMEVEKYDRFITEFPAYKNVNNAYSKYIEILATNDKSTWESAVDQYPELFSMLNDSWFIPNHIDVINANINLDGEFKIGEELVEYTKSGVTSSKMIDNQKIEVEKVEYPRSGSRGGSVYKEGYFVFGALKVGGGMQFDRILYHCVGPYPHFYTGKSVVGSWINNVLFPSKLIKLTDKLEDYRGIVDYTTTANNSSKCINNFSHRCFSTIFYRKLKIEYQLNNSFNPMTYNINTTGYN